MVRFVCVVFCRCAVFYGVFCGVFCCVGCGADHVVQRGAFGAACSDDARCADGLVCRATPRFDSGCGDDDHRTCTIACVVDDDCAAVTDEGAGCTGAGCDGVCFVANNGFE